MIELRAITIPAPELDRSGGLHVAYTVLDLSSGALRASAGWTLRDAIEGFAREYGVKRGDVKIVRPLIPQQIYLRRHGCTMWRYGYSVHIVADSVFHFIFSISRLIALTWSIP